MGLDAYVPCNCLERGKLSNPPAPFTLDDVYRDEEGFIASRSLDAKCAELGYSDYISQYESLDDVFSEWANHHACEHEYGEYFSERVSNWAGVRLFQSVVEELGGKSRYSALSVLIPDGNGGQYPVELASRALDELDDLLNRVKTLKFNALVCEDSEEPVWTCADRGSYPMMMGPLVEMGMEGNYFYFIQDGHKLLSRRFRQQPVDQPSDGGAQPMDVTLSETGECVRLFDSIGPHGLPKVAREFWVEPRTAPFMHGGHYYAAERIRSLLVASMEVQMPICWC